jgi:hypothetical protein
MPRSILKYLCRKSDSWVLACLVLASASNTANGDTLNITYSVAHDGQRINQNALLTGHIMPIKQLSNDPNLDMRFDAELQALHLTNHPTRNYKQIDVKTIEDGRRLKYCRRA